MSLVNPNGQRPPRAQLLITLHQDGSLQVQGSLTDKIQCYGLLESARDAIFTHFEKNSSKIVQANGPLPDRPSE